MGAPETGWIGVDLDGTLARYDRWAGIADIGEPVPEMADRVRAWLAGGYLVRIVTARASSAVPPKLRNVAIRAIEAWCTRHLGRALVVTAEKDFEMIELWDDRAVAVAHNRGRRLSPSVLPTEDATIESEVDDPTPPPSGAEADITRPETPDAIAKKRDRHGRQCGWDLGNCPDKEEHRLYYAPKGST